MKYILKKKWHPSQVEEVGHEFEEDEHSELESSIKNKSAVHFISPHEIALLVDAGYLEEYNEAKQVDWAKEMNKLGKEKRDLIRHLSIDSRNINTYTAPTIDLWTTEPPEGTKYWIVTDDGRTGWDRWGSQMFEINRDNFRLHTNNCHRTQKSAEEALKRLLEK